MFLKLLSLFLLTTTLTIFVVGSTSSRSITPGMYGIRTLDYEFIVPGNENKPNDDSSPIIASSEDGASGQIWFVLEDKQHPNQFYIQNVSSKKYLYVVKDHIYLNPKKYSHFKIQNVKDYFYTIKLANNSKLQWIATKGSSSTNNNSKDIVLSSTHRGTNNQFEFLMVLN